MLQTRKHIVLWIVTILCALLFLCAMLVLLPPQEEEPAPTEAPTTAPTQETTLPPPEENVFTPMDFGYDGEYMTCLTAPSIRGIDVSTFQKEIDWEQVKAAGFEFVIIRLGFRGFGEGTMEEDEWAQRNYLGARKAGLKIGGYFFSQAITVEEAIEEAEYVLQIVDGWQVDLPLVFDWEYIGPEYRTGNMTARMLTDCTKAFCDTIEEAGYESMVYFNPRQSEKQMYLEELTDYKFWLAMYSDEMGYPYKVDMWQYTCTGSVPGINGNVDINLLFPYDEEF